MGGFGWLWVVLAGCGWFSLVVGGSGWLWLVLLGCGAHWGKHGHPIGEHHAPYVLPGLKCDRGCLFLIGEHEASHWGTGGGLLWLNVEDLCWLFVVLADFC